MHDDLFRADASVSDTDNQKSTPCGLVNNEQRPTHDPFDPQVLGLNQDFATANQAKPVWAKIKVEKPSKARVFRVHPTHVLKTTLLVLKEDNEAYLVAPHLRHALADESLCGQYYLFACTTKLGTPFLWPIQAQSPDGAWNIWHETAYQIALAARTKWTRMQANRDAGHYVGTFDLRPTSEQQPAHWPDLEFKEWLRLSFQGFTIDSLSHPVLKRLRLED